MKKYIKAEQEPIMFMSNIRGDHVKVPHKLPFSFYFSTQQGQHEIRVKVVLDPSHMRISKAGTMKLCDDWTYTQGPDDKFVDQKTISAIKEFFRTYLILFAAVWDNQLDETAVQDYFQGEITLNDLIRELDFYTEDMDSIQTIGELEDYCRKYHLVDLIDK